MATLNNLETATRKVIPITGGVVNFFGCQTERSPELQKLIEETADGVAKTHFTKRESSSQKTRAQLVLIDSGFVGTIDLPNYLKTFLDGFKGAYALSSPGAPAKGLRDLLPSDVIRPDNLQPFKYLQEVRHLFKKPFVLGSLTHRFKKFGADHLDTVRALSQFDYETSTDAWKSDNGKELVKYYVELFSGRFRDRNGASLNFEFALDEFKLEQALQIDSLEVSPKVAGQIISTLTEFLGDKLFGVDFYSKGILDVFRERRQAEVDDEVNEIAIADKLATLQRADFSLLAADVPVYKVNATRQAIFNLETLDRNAISIGGRIAAVNLAIRGINAGTSKLRMVHTCDKSDVINNYMKCIFFEPDAASPPVCWAPAQPKLSRIGNTELKGDAGDPFKNIKEYDFADLVGTIVAFAAKNTEKGVRSLVGGLVRGISIASLDNEVISEVIASLIAGMSKKAAEAFAFEILTRFIKEPGIGGTTADKKKILASLVKLHLNGVFDPS